MWGTRDGPPDRSGNASGCLIVPYVLGVECLEDSARRDARPVREATSVRRGRTARTIEARTTTGGIRFNNYVSASRPLIGELS